MPNEPEALVINYFVRVTSESGASVTITDINGGPIATLKGPAEAGLNRVTWNMRRTGVPGGGGRGGAGGGSLLPAGDYRVAVSVAGVSR